MDGNHCVVLDLYCSRHSCCHFVSLARRRMYDSAHGREHQRPRKRTPTHRVSTVFVGIFGSVHLAACGAWLVKAKRRIKAKRRKRLTNPEEDVYELLESLSSSQAPIDLTTTTGKFETYIICAYFSTTVFSTVGFGDISPINTGERSDLLRPTVAGLRPLEACNRM